jgi:hypothetical protein
MTTSPSRCKASKADGSPCRGSARPGSDFCTFHDPALAERRRAGRKAGGEARRARKPAVAPGGDAGPAAVKPVPLAEAKDVKALLAGCINDLRAGRMDPKVGNAVGYLSGLLLKTFEQIDLAAEVEELKKLLPQQGRRAA